MERPPPGHGWDPDDTDPPAEDGPGALAEMLLTWKGHIMREKLRIGALGRTHDHVWSNLADLRASPLGDLVAAADPNPPLLERVRSEYDCTAVFESYEEMLGTTELDAVYVCADKENESTRLRESVLSSHLLLFHSGSTPAWNPAPAV